MIQARRPPIVAIPQAALGRRGRVRWLTGRPRRAISTACRRRGKRRSASGNSRSRGRCARCRRTKTGETIADDRCPPCARVCGTVGTGTRHLRRQSGRLVGIWIPWVPAGGCGSQFRVRVEVALFPRSRRVPISKSCSHSNGDDVFRLTRDAPPRRMQ